MLLFIGTSLLPSMVVAMSRAQNPYDPKAIDTTNHGDHLIKRCGKDVPGGKADQLTSLLEDIAVDLPSIIVEAADGVKSSYGFTNLFTSDDAASYCRQVLHQDLYQRAFTDEWQNKTG